MVGEGPKTKRYKTQRTPIQRNKDTKQSSFEHALQGIASGIAENQWAALITKSHVIVLEGARAQDLKLFEIPLPFSWIVQEDTEGEMDSDFFQYAYTIWQSSNMVDVNRPSDIPNSDEGMRSIKVEWLCFKNFLFNQLSGFEEVFRSFALAIDEAAATRDVEEYDIMIKKARQTLTVIETFERDIVEGSWLGCILRDFLAPKLGRSCIPFLSIFWSKEIKQWMYEAIRKCLSLDKLSSVFPPSEQFRHLRSPFEHVWSDLDEMNSSGETQDNPSIYIQLCPSGNGAEITSHEQRQVITCTGESHLTWVEKAQCMICTPLAHMMLKDGDSVHSRICRLVEYASEEDSQLNSFNYLQPHVSIQTSLASYVNYAGIRHTVVYLPHKEDLKSEARVKSESNGIQFRKLSFNETISARAKRLLVLSALSHVVYCLLGLKKIRDILEEGRNLT